MIINTSKIFGIATIAISLVACNGKNEESGVVPPPDTSEVTPPIEDNTSASTQSVNWQTKFPQLWSMAYASDVNPEDISYEQFLRDLALKLKNDQSFVTSIQGAPGAQGPRGLQGPAGPTGDAGATAPTMGAWEDYQERRFSPRDVDLTLVSDISPSSSIYANKRLGECESRLGIKGWLNNGRPVGLGPDTTELYAPSVWFNGNRMSLGYSFVVHGDAGGRLNYGIPETGDVFQTQGVIITLLDFGKPAIDWVNPVILRHDPTTGNTESIPLELNTSSRNVLVPLGSNYDLQSLFSNNFRDHSESLTSFLPPTSNLVVATQRRCQILN